MRKLKSFFPKMFRLEKAKWLFKTRPKSNSLEPVAKFPVPEKSIILSQFVTVASTFYPLIERILQASRARRWGVKMTQKRDFAGARCFATGSLVRLNRKCVLCLCVALILPMGISKHSLAYSQPSPPISNSVPVSADTEYYSPPYEDEEICETCCSPVSSCYCYYAVPGCYPSAPAGGVSCGLTYLSMGVAIALIVGVAAVVLSTGESVHSH